MIPVKALSEQTAILLAADATTLAPAVNPNKVGLVVANFNPTPDTVIGDLTISADTGLVPLAGVAGAQNESVDPLSGEFMVEIVPPAGGFRWETPPGFVGPVTVYGYALINDGATTLFGSEKLLTPIVLTGPNQAVVAPELTFRIDGTRIV